MRNRGSLIGTLSICYILLLTPKCKAAIDMPVSAGLFSDIKSVFSELSTIEHNPDEYYVEVIAGYIDGMIPDRLSYVIRSESGGVDTIKDDKGFLVVGFQILDNRFPLRSKGLMHIGFSKSEWIQYAQDISNWDWSQLDALGCKIVEYSNNEVWVYTVTCHFIDEKISKISVLRELLPFANLMIEGK